MNKLLLFFCTMMVLNVQAQTEKVAATNQIILEGELIHPFSFGYKDISEFQKFSLDSFVIYNHLHERKRVILHVTGILLSDLIQKAEINEKNPKLLSQFYVVCIASDGYQVVFSWNEIFNTEVGKGIMVVTQEDGQSVDMLSDRMLLLSARDYATGRRYVKGLQKVIVKRVS